MSKPLKSLIMTDHQGDMTFLKRDLIGVLSGYLKITNLAKQAICLMSLEEMADRFDQMYDNTGRTIYKINVAEFEFHFIDKIVIAECTKRLRAIPKGA